MNNLFGIYLFIFVFIAKVDFLSVIKST